MFEQRRGRHEVIIALLSLLSVSVALGAFETFPIAREPGNQQSPAIDDCIVVWQTDRYGDWDIGVADISLPGGVDPQTMTDPLSESQYPAVSGSVIVWESKFFMYDDRDIVGYDLAAEAFFDVRADYQDDALPAISGNLVVAQSRMTAFADWNIVGIDISDHNDVRAFWIDQNDEDQWRPDLDGPTGGLRGCVRWRLLHQRVGPVRLQRSGLVPHRPAGWPLRITRRRRQVGRLEGPRRGRERDRG